MTGVAQRSISSTARRDQRRVGEQRVPLVGVLDQRQHAVGDEVARRLVAGDREQQEEQVELQLGQAVAVDLGAEQRR